MKAISIDRFIIIVTDAWQNVKKTLNLKHSWIFINDRALRDDTNGFS